MADRGEPWHGGLASVTPSSEVGQLQAQQRSAQFKLIVKQPPVRGWRIGVRPALEADFVVKVADDILRRHLEDRRI